MIKIGTTREMVAESGLKILAYGEAGSGKTTAIGTIEGNPLIITAEKGLLPIAHLDLPAVAVSTVEEIKEVHRHITSKEGNVYDWVVIDSISEIAECVLSREKKETSDVRQAYGALIDKMGELIRMFRDLPMNVYMTAKMEKIKDEVTGAMMFSPSLPGAKLSSSIPYLFDEVFVLRAWRDKETNEVKRAFQTVGDSKYVAKDRSGALDEAEPPDLGAIARKIAAYQKSREKRRRETRKGKETTDA